MDRRSGRKPDRIVGAAEVTCGALGCSVVSLTKFLPCSGKILSLKELSPLVTTCVSADLAVGTKPALRKAQTRNNKERWKTWFQVCPHAEDATRMRNTRRRPGTGHCEVNGSVSPESQAAPAGNALCDFQAFGFLILSFLDSYFFWHCRQVVAGADWSRPLIPHRRHNQHRNLHQRQHRRHNRLLRPHQLQLQHLPPYQLPRQHRHRKITMFAELASESIIDHGVQRVSRHPARWTVHEDQS